ncbi:MAG TPA: GNAT family N-acetyltransferase [Chitinophagales bacterium]|nr:GNAT family N-acetyltransferase [Chitinophagales bacterium]
MLIRKAKVEDSKEIAELLLLAMEDIVYQFIGINSLEQATRFLENSTSQPSNQYSYENCWVIESNQEVVAVVNFYDGAKLQELRAPIHTLIKSMFDREYSPEDETQKGELYIDCIGVRLDRQGKGLGSKILQFLIDEYSYKSNKTLGLLVDKDNPNAKKLYLKLGFEIIDEMTLVGKEMEHLQFKNKNL